MKRIMIYILTVLVLLGVTGGIAYSVIREKGTGFYVEYDGEKYYKDEILQLPEGTSEFSVKGLAGDRTDFTVKIISNPAQNFSFTVGEELWWLYDTDETLNDYSEIFRLEINGNGFNITIPQGFTVEQAVELRHGTPVKLTEELNGRNYFLIAVTVNGKTLELPFEFRKTTVTVDPPCVIF